MLDRVSVRIVNEVPHINRIVYDITSKPPANFGFIIFTGRGNPDMIGFLRGGAPPWSEFLQHFFIIHKKRAN